MYVQCFCVTVPNASCVEWPVVQFVPPYHIYPVQPYLASTSPPSPIISIIFSTITYTSHVSTLLLLSLFSLV